MKKYILIALLVLSFSRCYCQDTALNNDECLINKSIYMLKLPNSNSKHTANLNKGDTIKILNEKNGYVFIDFKGIDGFIPTKYLLNSKGFKMAEWKALSDVKSFSNEEKGYIKKYGKKFGLLVMGKEVAIGMTESMVVEISGKPEHVNKSHYSFGIYEQWIYSKYDEHQYYYFKNGRLTSWQDTN